jgi:hypothetical protein
MTACGATNFTSKLEFTTVIPAVGMMRQKDYTFKDNLGWVLVAHACNLSFLGGRDQKDHGLRPNQENSFLSQKYSKQ